MKTRMKSVFWTSFAIAAFGKLALASENTEILECRTAKNIVKVDASATGAFRYRIWKGKVASERKPDLELKDGQQVIEGTGPCRHRRYTFTNGVYRYEVGELGCTDGSEPRNTVGVLRAYRGKKQLSEEWCVNR